MLIIYGKKQVIKTIGSGEFSCPGCKSDQPYYQKSFQEKRHIYWLSLLPIGKKLEYVECRSCEATFDPEVLEGDYEGSQDYYRSDFEKIIIRLMVLMMLADGTVSESEIEQLMLIFENITDQSLSRSEVEEDISEASIAGHSVKDYLPALVEVLSDDAKDMVIQAVLLIAAADGNIDDSESVLLMEVADGLEMSETDLNRALNSAK